MTGHQQTGCSYINDGVEGRRVSERLVEVSGERAVSNERKATVRNDEEVARGETTKERRVGVIGEEAAGR